MRFKKHKRQRKAVKFYEACFGFRQPYKVLCDGTFVNHLIVNRIVPADKAVSNVVGGSAKLFTTRCVLAELKRLGVLYSESFQAANMLSIAKCNHEKRKSAEACITEIVVGKNSDHFFVATQDADMREKLRQMAMAPIVYGLRNSLFLEQPSDFQRQLAKASEKGRSHMNKLEYNTLKLENNEMRNGDLEPVRVAYFAGRGGTNSVKDSPRFKRKKAKGPNPLSCMKKKALR